ncbi:ubiquinol-cytochrome C chaperone family protein [Henriciella marina]|uniref:ubiquinol-cytochrome C chaperone family protein n=1 Tax=Henriciella marina TaxID=453851 RepID=UPI00036EF1FB|nr:ubiquinol-cytochrome C chaperone family protein [Henriciella marina]
MQRLRNLFTSQKSRDRSEAAKRLHKDVTARSRAPRLYGGNALEDTIEGRTNCIALFAGLVTGRLAAIGPEGQALSSRLTDSIFDEIDAGLRETGVGDASIARKVRKIGERFVGLGIAVNEAFAGNNIESDLASMIERNGLASGDGTFVLRTSMMRAHASLASQADDALLAGQTGWDQS